MIAITRCEHENTKKHGKDRNDNQRYRCLDCGKTFTESRAKPIGNMRLDLSRALLVLNMLLEGMSIRAAERITGVHRDTIDDLILVVGENCQRLLDRMIQDVPVNAVQIDEIWSFIGCKDKHAKRMGYGPEMGDSWTFIAIEANTKLVLTHHVGQRNEYTTKRFLAKVRKATTGRFQVTTDGLRTYTYNVPFELDGNVDFAQLIKTYKSQQSETRYSPATITGIEKIVRYGHPDEDKISTSYIERLNLTLRMNMRRFTRLTNGHSKSLRHHEAMQALLFAWYNFCRKHLTLKTTPAVSSGLADAPWTIKELLLAAST